jgi:hypothetical protein
MYSGRSLLAFLGSVLPQPTRSCETLATIWLQAVISPAVLLFTLMAGILYVSLNCHPWDQTALQHVSWFAVVSGWERVVLGLPHFVVISAGPSTSGLSSLCRQTADPSSVRRQQETRTLSSSTLYSTRVPKLLCTMRVSPRARAVWKMVTCRNDVCDTNTSRAGLALALC